MQVRGLQRRWVWAALALGFGAPKRSAAARPHLTLATGLVQPLCAPDGRSGFLDRLLGAAFDRIGVDVILRQMPFRRALINANAGIEDGDPMRAPGFELEYPNLVQVPESVLDLDFVAFARRTDIQVHGWDDLSRHSLAYVNGWKIFERRVKAGPNVATVRNLDQLFPMLISGRADVVLVDRWEGLWLARQAGLAARPQEPPLARRPMFTYLHRRHAALVPPLAAALAALKRDGTWQRLYDQILLPLESAR